MRDTAALTAAAAEHALHLDSILRELNALPDSLAAPQPDVLRRLLTAHQPADLSDVVRRQDRDALLRYADSRIRRCTCGAWAWATRPCTTCSHLYEIEEFFRYFGATEPGSIDPESVGYIDALTEVRAALTAAQDAPAPTPTEGDR